VAAGDAIARAAAPAERLQKAIDNQKEIINRQQRQVDWLLERSRKCNVDIALEFWAKVESGEFG
jgi:hypothetical protein